MEVINVVQKTIRRILIVFMEYQSTLEIDQFDDFEKTVDNFLKSVKL